MNNNLIWLVLSAAIGSLSVMIGYLFVPLLIDGQIIRADILGSLGTWAGSIATVGTLIFLIRQNIELREQQEKQQTQQNINEEKQHEMWKSQNEMLTFQKYELHYKMFNEMLDRIETEDRFRGIYVFRERSSAYQQLFPFNNLLQCTSDLSQISNLSSHPLIKADEQLKNISIETEKIAHVFSSKNSTIFELNKQLYALTLNLGLMLKEPKQVGSIRIGTFEHNAFFNITRGLDCLCSLFHIINELRRFSHLPCLNDEHLLEYTKGLFNHIFYINYILSISNENVMSCNLGKHKVLSKIVQGVYFLNKIKQNEANLLCNELESYFVAQVSSENLKKLEQESFIKDLYERITVVLMQASQEGDIELSNYLTELNELKLKITY
ncbi:hypothetical protein [Aliivibrio fischeri]|uniref:Uncharacterized protein n=1 Tax=Aliivibrio fischeri TaxID=668 RepID=A0A844P4P9_ALIFS|nr:hypothetical protein [Aliivibrio fischeri]MUK51073.1 hypothetical protein [Aliivibrio fischeri]